MQKLVLRAGVISVGSLAISQLIRFAGNLILAALLAPEAFGVVGVVNLILVGINLFSDLGLRQVVIQHQEELSDEFLNTIWTLQILRGLGIFVVAFVLVGALWLAQAYGLVVGNVYADPALPLLLLAASLTAICNGFESTGLITERRELRIGRCTAISLISQVGAMCLMIVIAKITATPWALVAGAVAAAAIQSALSHIWLDGIVNRRYLDKKIAWRVLRNSRWILVSSPMTFLESNVEVLILGALVNSQTLGAYMIAFLLAGVVRQLSQTLAGNVLFPALSKASREGVDALRSAYTRFQLISDAIIVTAAGAIIAAGQSIVDILFDSRYATAGPLLTYLAIGLVGLRYYVIEQLANAQGKFKMGPPVILCRITALVVGTFVGFELNGMQGAAIGIGCSWFAGWPVLLWFRAKTIPWPWKVEAAAMVFLAAGYGIGTLFTAGVHLLHR